MGIDMDVGKELYTLKFVENITFRICTYSYTLSSKLICIWVFTTNTCGANHNFSLESQQAFVL